MKNNLKNIKICFFGSYDKDYTSNKLMLQGLESNDIDVLEVNSHVPVTKLIHKSDLTPFKLIGRIIKKYRLIGQVFKNISRIKKCTALYVGYPGHFDVLLAYPIAKIFKLKLIFNPLVIIYTGFSEEQGILSQKSLLGKIIKFGESVVYNCCDLVFADTPFQKKYLKKIFNVKESKLKVLPIGADNKFYRYTKYTNLKKTLNVVYYGLYSPIHGVEHIIKAASLLNSDRDIVFNMVGNGNTFEKNFNEANKMGLKNIIFHHNVPVDKHPQIIEKADVFLGFLQKHPSVDRIIPNKIYQGLALGKVVLTADAPVIRSMFQHMIDIYTCQPSDPKALAISLIHLKNNPKLRRSIAEMGYQKYLNEFTPIAVANRLMQYLYEIL